MEKIDEECVKPVEVLCRAHSSYAAYTKYAFAFTETVAIAKLLYQGLDRKTINHRVVEDDLFQIRSRNSRQGAFQTIWQRLEKLPPDYV